MKFRRMSEFFERLEATAKRLEMFDILAELFREADKDEIDKIVYLSQGNLLPPFAGLEFGISDKLLIKTLSEVSNIPSREVEALYKKTGDLGLAAEELLKGKGTLDVSEAYAELKAIAEASGKGSQERKTGLLGSLLRGVSPKDARYIARFVLGKLRLGIGDPTVLEALALSEGDRALRAELERAYNQCSDLGLVARTLKSGGMEEIRKFKVKVGFPIRPALCERVPLSEDIIKKMGRAAIEAKYDGLRLQIHKDGPKVEIFSRNLERMTHMFPEITGAVKSHIKAKQAVFEGEALAYNEDAGEFLPFQVTIQRKRKHDIEKAARDFPLRFFAFDLLFADGEDCTVFPYEKRRQMLESLIEKDGIIQPAEMFLTDNPKVIDEYFEKYVERGLEGIVAKRLDSLYTAGARNFNWIKLKRSYRGELADTVDVCIVGYFKGRGQRARFGIGALLGAVYDPKEDVFKTVSKVGSGFTDEEFIELRKMLDEISLKHKHPRVESVMEPDVWVKPRYAVTVTADEITRSPSHTAGKDQNGVGYALRFPRAMGFIRPDKNAEDANTVAEIISMFDNQARVKTK